jgi:uncharacterized membrane protein
MTITGTSGSLYAATALGLTVTAAGTTTPPAGKSFALSDSATSMTVAQGHSVTSTVKITPSGGFNSAVTLKASNLPNGVTASFSPSSTKSSSTLKLTASKTARVFAYGYVTVTATSGSLSKTITVPVDVTKASAK